MNMEKAVTGKVFLVPARLRRTRDFRTLRLEDLTPCNAAAFGAKDGHVADLGNADMIVTYSNSGLFRRRQKLVCKLGVLMFEPPAVQPRHYFTMKWLWRRFDAVITYCPKLLAAVPNAIRFNSNQAWATPAPEPQKTELISLIASAKRDLKGHRLRLRLAERHRERLTLLGRKFKPFADKNEGVEPYFFSVAIENSRSPGYATEKIIDCFLTKTVPIYWGDPTIGENFNTDGIICCNTERELDAAIRSVTEADYKKRIEAIEDNFLRALPFTDMPARLGALLTAPAP